MAAQRFWNWVNSLTAKTSLVGTEEIYINDSGVSKKATASNFAALVLHEDQTFTGTTKLGDGTSHYTQVASDGTLTLVGNATAWDDYMIPGTSVKATGTSPPDLLGSFVGDNTLDLYAFDGVSLLEQVFFTIQLPHCWKEGSTIYPHVHFSPVSTNSADTTPRVVRFGFEYTWASIGSAFGAPNTIYLDSAAFVPNTSQWKHLLCVNGTGIAGTGHTLSSMLVCRLFRDPADSVDTYPQDVAFLQFDIHYERDGFGSAQEFIK